MRTSFDRRRLVHAVALAIGVALVAAGAGASAQSQPGPAAVVHIKNYLFVPDVVRIHPGQSVAWIEDDDDAHTATAADGSWDSGRLDKGQTYTRAFASTGTYEYDCAYHEYMRAKVIVTE